MINVLILIVTLISFKSMADVGKVLFITKCTQCHNTDPSKTGAVGPDIADSSFELIKLKTQQRKYPTGYRPKRKTLIMPVIKLTDAQIESIRAYIATFKKSNKEVK